MGRDLFPAIMAAAASTGRGGGPSLSAEDAVDEVLRLERYTDDLERTLGAVTMMLWGALGGAIFLSYNLLGAALPNGAWPWWGTLLWAPWVAIGVLITHTLWSGAAVTRPDLAPTMRQNVLMILLWVGGMALGGLVLGTALPQADENTWYLLVYGAIWGLAALAGAMTDDPMGRRVNVAVGLATVVLALAGTFLVVPLGYGATAALAVGTALVLPTVGGLVVLRGR